VKIHDGGRQFQQDRCENLKAVILRNGLRVSFNDITPAAAMCGKIIQSLGGLFCVLL
jgi:hypothetical protein